MPDPVFDRTRNAAFLIIHCPEDIARELYIGSETCAYSVRNRLFQVLMGLGTLLLMMAVALMSNCTWDMQLALGISYILLNALYWGAAMLPADWNWNLDRYELRLELQVKLESYTEALWQAIKITGKDGTGYRREGRYSAAWVQISAAAPKTSAWNNWLKEAEESVNIGNDEWDAVAAWQKLQKEEEVEAGAEHADIIRYLKRDTVDDIPLNQQRLHQD